MFGLTQVSKNDSSQRGQTDYNESLFSKIKSQMSCENALTPTLRQELLKINHRIDRIGQFISHNKKNDEISSTSERKSPTLTRKVKESDSKTKSQLKTDKNVTKSRHAKSSSDVLRSSIEKLQKHLSMRKSVERNTSSSKDKSTSNIGSSRGPRIHAFAMKNITIKNIVVNANPRFNSIKQAEPYTISSLRPPTHKKKMPSLDYMKFVQMKDVWTSATKALLKKQQESDQQASIDEQADRL